MESSSRVLLVGGTGLLGGEIARQLSAAGQSVRALVRETSDPSKRAALSSLPGVETVPGDLKEPASLAQACAGVQTVVTTASCTGSRQEGDSIESVDDGGTLALLAAAVAQGVRRFVYLSFPEQAIDSPLQRAKRRSERAIMDSGLEYVILQPAYFTEVWFSPALGWDALQGKVRLFGDGTSRMNWISFKDVARFAVAACIGDQASYTLELGGPEALSQREVLALYQAGAAPEGLVEQLSESSLRTMHGASSNSLEQSFAALMLTVAVGQVIDTSPQLRVLPGALASVRDHVAAVSRNG